MAKAFTVKDMYNFVNLNDAKLKKNRVMVCILLSILIESTLYHINNKIYKSRLMRSTKAGEHKIIKASHLVPPLLALLDGSAVFCVFSSTFGVAI